MSPDKVLDGRGRRKAEDVAVYGEGSLCTVGVAEKEKRARGQPGVRLGSSCLCTCLPLRCSASVLDGELELEA